MSEAVTSSVKAILRVRPALQQEAGHEKIIEIDGNKASIINPRNTTQNLDYTFDGCYGEKAGQDEIFKNNLKPLLGHFMTGCNATVFAYGNTGAGKTFTMQGSPTNPGMIQRSLSHLLASLSAKQEKFQSRWTLKMSYLEIYKEKVYDLLAVNPAATDLQLREDQTRRIVIPGLTQVPIRNMEEFDLALTKGMKNRSMAATKLNSQSSRSHACLTLELEQKPPLGLGVQSKLHLIDLAGSEDNRRTENSGERLVESGAINSSLFVLGQVVDALNKNSPRIPFRDSKLTRLLQDSLGGRAYALIITNVAPTVNWSNETAASLNFAAKSRLIQNRVIINTIEEPVPVPVIAPVKSQKKSAPTKRRERSEELSDISSYEEEDSVYELSEAPSSAICHGKRHLTPPETKSNSKKTHRSSDNPFIDASNPIESVIDRQIEEKVAAKLREISKGTVLSPLLRDRTMDLVKLKKAIAKKGSKLSRLVAEGSENAGPNAKPKKTKKQEAEAKMALEEINGLTNMFPTVEPDLLHVLNHGTIQQLRKLKELGQSRAESVLESRPFDNLALLHSKEVFTPKVLLKIVYENAMHADNLASLAHQVSSSGGNVEHPTNPNPTAIDSHS